MSETLLRTKLYIPTIRSPNLVPRPHLIERLDQGLQHGHKLTLISAPAGFGKTTLLSAWAAGSRRSVAWLSLDDGDNDPTRFLAYLVAALQTIMPAVGESVLAALHSPQPSPTESVLTLLLNELTAVPDNFILVLDDYHVIDAQPVDNTLTFLIEHQPPQMHLVIATREDPDIPLPRLRARGQLTELRAAELRFTPAEAAGFFNQVMGLNLSAEEIAALESRTEGWIAGLQLAAISMRGRTDTAAFIHAFTGSHHFVLDYLVEEVLQQQSDHVRSFLLQTSILDRLTAPLCNAVTGQEDGKAMLEALQRANLFVVPLDDRRRWYRYHHLFADVLRAHVMEQQPNQVPALHQRASAWYEQNGLRSAAIHQALAAEDLEQAAGLMELAWQDMDNSFQAAAWLGWVEKLPDDLIRTRPVLSTQYAGALLMEGDDLEASESRLQDAEHWLDSTGEMSAQPEASPGKMVVVDEEQFQMLPARIAIIRAQTTLAQGDLSAATKHAELAIKLVPEGNQLRPQTTTLLGFTQWASGDLETAHRVFADWVGSMLKAGNIYFAVASAFVLADINTAQGRLREAERTYKHSLQLASEQDKVVQKVTAHHYLGLAMLYHEMHDQEASTQHLLKSKALGKQSVLLNWHHRWCLARARLEEAEGDLQAALDLLDEAKRLYIRTQVPDTHPIEALKARIYVRQGRLAQALNWVQEQGLSIDDDLSYLREFEHITLARVLMDEYKSSQTGGSLLQAIGLLERLLNAAEEGGRIGSVIEILLLQTLALQAQGDIPRALKPLERALTLAEPEGYVRIFIDEGPPMSRVLREAAARGIAPDYVGRLLAAFSTDGPEQASSVKTHSAIRVPNSELVDPLSERELEVLKLLETELNGPQIARELMVSLNTMRTHTRNIYSKLEVNNRRAAVRRAEELDLL